MDVRAKYGQTLAVVRERAAQKLGVPQEGIKVGRHRCRLHSPIYLASALLVGALGSWEAR